MLSLTKPLNGICVFGCVLEGVTKKLSDKLNFSKKDASSKKDL